MNEHPMAAALTDYLAVRRSLGFKLTRDGLLLGQFIDFCEQSGVDRITSEVALAWVTTPAKASPSWLTMRLSVVRGFARWLQAFDPSTEVPPLGWLPPVRRGTPYLYTDAEIAALMAAARRARWPLSAATYETLIGLVAVTGLRIGEAIRLDRADLSLADGLLTIRESKLDKSRQVLVQPSTVKALRAYLRRRAALSPAPGEAALSYSSTLRATGSTMWPCRRCSVPLPAGPGSGHALSAVGPPSTDCATPLPSTRK